MSRTITTTKEVFTYEELSQTAKYNAYREWNSNTDYCFSDEIKGILNEFCNLFDVDCPQWEFNGYNTDYRFYIMNDDIKGLEGIRLARYIWNNYSEYIMKGKCFSLWSKTEKSEKNPNYGELKSRHSKVMFEMDNCPLTGICFDCSILQPIIDCLHYKTFYDSYEELIDDCLVNFFEDIQKDIEYQGSEERFIEEANDYGYEFDENGTMI